MVTGSKQNEDEWDFVEKLCERRGIKTQLFESHIKLEGRKLEYDYLIIKGKLLRFKFESDPEKQTSEIQAEDRNGNIYIITVEQLDPAKLDTEYAKALKGQFTDFKDEFKPNFDDMEMISSDKAFAIQPKETVTTIHNYFLKITAKNPSKQEKTIELESEFRIERAKALGKNGAAKIEDFVQNPNVGTKRVEEIIAFTENLIAVTTDENRRRQYELERELLEQKLEQEQEKEEDEKFESEMAGIRDDIDEVRERMQNKAHSVKEEKKDDVAGPTLGDELTEAISKRESAPVMVEEEPEPPKRRHRELVEDLEKQQTARKREESPEVKEEPRSVIEEQPVQKTPARQVDLTYKIGRKDPDPGFFRRVFNKIYDLVLPHDRKLNDLFKKLEKQAAISNSGVKWYFEAEDLVTLMELREGKEKARFQSTRDKIDELVREAEKNKNFIIINKVYKNAHKNNFGLQEKEMEQLKEILDPNNRVEKGSAIPGSSTLIRILEGLKPEEKNVPQSRRGEDDETSFSRTYSVIYHNITSQPPEKPNVKPETRKEEKEKKHPRLG